MASFDLFNSPPKLKRANSNNIRIVGSVRLDISLISPDLAVLISRPHGNSVAAGSPTNSSARAPRLANCANGPHGKPPGARKRDAQFPRPESRRTTIDYRVRPCHTPEALTSERGTLHMPQSVALTRLPGLHSSSCVTRFQTPLRDTAETPTRTTDRYSSWAFPRQGA
jgi:hypothetical protein